MNKGSEALKIMKHLTRSVWLVSFVIGALTGGLAWAPLSAGVAAPILVDGLFKDWKSLAVVEADPEGDGRAGGIDLQRLWIANDATAFYFKLEVGSETLLQNSLRDPIGNQLRLYLDLDNSPTTGSPVEGLGVEVAVRFGERRVTVYTPGGSPLSQVSGGTGLIHLPTHSSKVFEILVPFEVSGSVEAVNRLQNGGEVALFFREETSGGDRLPDVDSVTYMTSVDPVKTVRSKSLAKKRRKHVRLLSMNTANSTIEVEGEVYTRILRGLQPDIIAFQEVRNWNGQMTREFVEGALPLPDGGVWFVAQVADTVTLSKFPILNQSAVDNNLVVHIDLPNEITEHDLVLFNVHTPCCSNNEARDSEHDNLMVTWRGLLNDQGPFSIAPKDAVVLTGDFNMVGYRRQFEVIRNGTFIDPSNGPNFSPGRGKGSLAVAKPRHTHARLVHTWRRNASDFVPGRLDFIFYSRDVARLKKSFVLDTAALPGAVLERNGLRADDSLVASDHLVLVADFLFR